jgi:DNA polymerase
MRRVVLTDGGDLAEWRAAARTLLAARVPPPQVQWVCGVQGDLLETLAEPLEPAADNPANGNTGPMPDVRVPREFLALAELVLAHADPQRHALLYRLLWRLVHGERALLGIATDPDVAWARAAASAVRRERHKMKAFVRFREVTDADGPVYVAWFEPAHDVLPLVAPFFARRFAGMRWSILTPSRSAYWDGIALHLGSGASRSDAPGDDALEELWRVYYGSTFNPARLKVATMRKEMPVRYWKHLPEARLIPTLIRDAGARTSAMLAASPTLPRKPRLDAAAAPRRGRHEAR